MSDATSAYRHWLSPIVFVLAVGVLGGVVGFTPLRSLDYWWHLRTGELIVETGAVPRADPYTYTVPEAPWTDLHWTFQLALHGLHRAGGHQAVRLAKGVCVLALLAVLGAINWRRSRAAVTSLALGSMVMASASRLMERPELPSFLLLALVLALLERHRRVRDGWVFAIVPLQLLWANLHGSFAIGIAVSAMALAGELLQPWIRRDQALERDVARDLALVIALSIAVSVLNPNGLDALLLTFEQLGMIGPAERRNVFGRWVTELRPTLAAADGVTRLAAAGGLALAAMALNARRLRPFDALLFMAFFVLALGAQRNVALLALATTPITVHNLNEFLDRRRFPKWGLHAAAVAVFCLLLFSIAKQVKEQGAVWDPSAVLQHRFPEAAADWITRESPDGPIYHSMRDGGYLIWRLYPEYRGMVDGRLEVFGAERYAPLSARVSGRPGGFRQLDEVHHFGVVLLNHQVYRDLKLLQWLHRNPEWRLVELDEIAALFVRVGADPPPWPEIGSGGSDLFRPIEANQEPVHDFRLRASRIALLRVLGRPKQARELTRETCVLYSDLAPKLCGDASVQSGAAPSSENLR